MSNFKYQYFEKKIKFAYLIPIELNMSNFKYQYYEKEIELESLFTEKFIPMHVSYQNLLMQLYNLNWFKYRSSFWQSYSEWVSLELQKIKRIVVYVNVKRKN